MNSRNVILTAIAIAILATGWFFFLRPTAPASKPTLSGGTLPDATDVGGANTTVQQPLVGTSGTPQMTITARNGSTLTVNDFIHNGETAADVVNPGDYYLAGSVGYCLANGSCPSGASTTDFSIVYSQQYNLFNVTLLVEPLSSIREEAEQFLMSRLGITQDQMCALDYNVVVPYTVNPVYTGKNLGFSFCPGAVQVP